MYNIDKSLKEKIINHEIITDEEFKIFINYVLNKSDIITSHMTDIHNYSKINLINEIFWSYNLESDLCKINNHYFITFIINNKEYIFDNNFTSDKLLSLKDNHYIEYKDNYQEYIKVLEEEHE